MNRRQLNTKYRRKNEKGKFSLFLYLFLDLGVGELYFSLWETDTRREEVFKFPVFLGFSLEKTNPWRKSFQLVCLQFWKTKNQIKTTFFRSIPDYTDVP